MDLDKAVADHLARQQDAKRARRDRYRARIAAAEQVRADREAARQKILDEQGPAALMRADVRYAMSGGTDDPFAPNPPKEHDR